MTDTEPQVIQISAGAIEYTWPLTITETTGKDISSVPIALALGTAAAPVGTWYTPDVDRTQSPSSKRIVQLLIGDSIKPAAGITFLWSRVTDDPEVVPRRHQMITIS